MYKWIRESVYKKRSIREYVNKERPIIRHFK